jgi:AsmA protein
VFKIENGVAKVDLMKLLNPVLGIDGTGQIDLGWQKLDVRLATAIDKKAKSGGSVVQLNGIPVPVRLSGNWAAIKVTPDLSGVETALRAEAGGKVRDTITDRLGSAGGGIASDVLGLPKRETPAPETPATGQTVEPAPAPEKKPTLEELGRKKAQDALGGLLGKKKPAPAPADAPPPVPPAPEPAPADPAPVE